MDDETFLCIESLSRIEKSWDVKELLIPCVTFDGPLPIAVGSGFLINAADCIGHGAVRLVASTFSPNDVSRRGYTRYTRHTRSYFCINCYFGISNILGIPNIPYQLCIGHIFLILSLPTLALLDGHSPRYFSQYEANCHFHGSTVVQGWWFCGGEPK